MIDSNFLSQLPVFACLIRGNLFNLYNFIRRSVTVARHDLPPLHDLKSSVIWNLDPQGGCLVGVFDLPIQSAESSTLTTHVSVRNRHASLFPGEEGGLFPTSPHRGQPLPGHSPGASQPPRGDREATVGGIPGTVRIEAEP